MLAPVGVTDIEVMLASVTVTDVEPLTVPEVAVIVADPSAMPVTSPELLTVAVAVEDVAQETLFVRVFVVPSSKVPVAVICRVLPS